MQILLVEDEPKLASFIKKGFENEGYPIDIAFDGKMGKSLFDYNLYDLIILDVNLPYINGFELCKIIRQSNAQIPILMLTALDNLTDKLTGFDTGADDYLVKPFAFKELLARTRVLIKRSSAHKVNEDSVLKIADLEINLHSKTVTRNGQRIDLTTREYSLLEHFIRNKGKVISRVDISEQVWEIDFDTSTNIIDVYVSYLRRKIDKGFSPKLIHTVVGMGYVMRID